MVFSDADEVEADLIGQRTLVDHVTKDFRLGQWLSVGIDGHVAERIESQFNHDVVSNNSANRRLCSRLPSISSTAPGSRIVSRVSGVTSSPRRSSETAIIPVAEALPRAAVCRRL